MVIAIFFLVFNQRTLLWLRIPTAEKCGILL